MTADVSIGVPGALGPEAVRRLAPRVEAAGFAGIWLNDSPQGDSLAGLAAAAEVTTHLRLASGVIPVDRRPGPAILDDLRRTGVPETRLTLGIGSGQLRTGAVDAVAEAVGVLRQGSRAAVVVGALGPRMRRLGAEHADGVLLSWLTPAVAAEQAEELRAVGTDAQGERPRIALYARAIVDEAARPALERESVQYGSYPAYAANFARLGIRPIDTTLPAVDGGFAAGVAAYRAAIDELCCGRSRPPARSTTCWRSWTGRPSCSPEPARFVGRQGPLCRGQAALRGEPERTASRRRIRSALVRPATSPRAGRSQVRDGFASTKNARARSVSGTARTAPMPPSTTVQKITDRKVMVWFSDTADPTIFGCSPDWITPLMTA